MTTAETALVVIAKRMTPAQFIAKITDDEVILAFLNLVLAEINNTAPGTSFTIDTMPASWQYIVAFGGQIFANLFLQGGYALEDFNYSDNGLSLNVDRHSSLNAVYANTYNNYSRMVEKMKKVYAISAVRPQLLSTMSIGTVFQQVLGQIFPGTWVMR